MSRVGWCAFGLLSAALGCSDPEGAGTNTNWLRVCQNDGDCGGLTCTCGRCTSGCAIDADCAALGCSDPEGAGTNTNWLRVCQSDGECGGLTCACGRCTSGCAVDADCAALGGICSPRDSTLLQCRGGQDRPLCLAACTTSEDCHSGQVCLRGTCTDTLTAASCADHPDALVCEDFEGSVAQYLPVVTAGNAADTVAVATPSGARALEARVLVAPSTAYLRADFTPVLSGVVAMRGWFQLPAGQTTYDLAPLGFWAAGEPEWALRVVAKDGRLEAWSYTTPLAGSAELSVGEWHCVEATIGVADSTGSVQITLDGSLVVDATGVDTLPSGGIGSLAMGTEWAGATATILVDRVLVGSTATGCWN